jgi:hypothetical protein
MNGVKANPYRSLGLWLKEHARSSDTVAFTEFGQLHYYSGHDIVDYLGLVTPGAAQHLRNGDAIWTFKRYRPTWFVDTSDHEWHYFVNPLEYDWFRASYEPVTTMYYAGAFIKRFSVYRLRGKGEIPAPEDRDLGSKVTTSSDVSSLKIELEPSTAFTSAVEVRLSARSACPNLNVAWLRPNFDPILRRSLPQGITRIRIPAGFGHEMPPYVLQLNGCPGVDLAPPTPQRRGYIFLAGNRPKGVPANAVTVYHRS